MRVIYTVEPYNVKRFSKPWIARIKSWEVGAYPVLEFGANSGYRSAEVEAAPGEVVKIGQKDNRNPKYTVNKFAVVEEDGSLRVVSGEEARELWIKKNSELEANPLEAFSNEEILAEARRRGLI